MTILEAIKAVSSYPIPLRTITRFAAARDLNVNAEVNSETLASREFQFAEADVMMWLTKAPIVTEGGVTITLSAEEKSRLLADASEVYAELGTRERLYGYKGEDL